MVTRCTDEKSRIDKEKRLKVSMWHGDKRRDRGFLHYTMWGLLIGGLYAPFPLQRRVEFLVFGRGGVARCLA